MPSCNRLWKTGTVLFCAGLFYAFVLIPLGIRVPCLFRLLTGWRCPGCGITDCFLHLLHGQFRAALSDNLGLTAAAPVLLGLSAAAWRGTLSRSTFDRCTLALAMVLLGWGILRNPLGL